MASLGGRQRPIGGFYGSGHTLNDVFVYDATNQDAVWLRMGSFDLLDAEREGEWPLPDDPAEFAEWCDRYNFGKITTAQAQPAIRDYLRKLQQYLDPEGFAEVIRDPSMSVAFIRAVRGFLTELEEL